MQAKEACFIGAAPIVVQPNVGLYLGEEPVEPPVDDEADETPAQRAAQAAETRLQLASPQSASGAQEVEEQLPVAPLKATDALFGIRYFGPKVLVGTKGKSCKFRPACACHGCTNRARKGPSDVNFCIRHGGGKRCSFAGCGRGAHGKTDTCVKHGGGIRCCVVMYHTVANSAPFAPARLPGVPRSQSGTTYPSLANARCCRACLKKLSH